MASSGIACVEPGRDGPVPRRDIGRLAVRMLGWSIIGFLAAFLLNDYLTYWRGWPGPLGIKATGASSRAWGQAGLYAVSVVAAASYVLMTPGRQLRAEAPRVSAINNVLIGAAFWAVLAIGLIDVTLAFLRLEELLPAVVGSSLADELIRAHTRGAYVHMPLFVLAVVVAGVTRTVGITWLALLIVIAELQIVMFRFVFSYEQTFMSDLVRFWHAALFLFASAYTLREEAHVRIDVLYGRFSRRGRGIANTVGALAFGIPFCWVLLVIGTSGRTGILNSALSSYEIEGLGDTLYVKYLMTAFMGGFAITMLIQFIAFLFDAAADWRGEPGRSGDSASQAS